MKQLSPQQKKQYSYQKDCRNNYGENDKASRKNIPKSKQRGHQEERRLAHQLLTTLPTNHDELELANTMSLFQSNIKAKRLNAFKKYPDLPLGKMLAQRYKKRFNTSNGL